MDRYEGLGVLYGVGVGPGDPGLVTLAAAEMIGRVTTVAFPVHEKGGSSRALDTVRRLISPEQKLLPLLMPMTRDRVRLTHAHEAAAEELVQAAAFGHDVVYLSLGDPLFYSTFGYLAERYPGQVEIVSGVTAINMTAAALGQPVAAGDTPMVVLTGADRDTLRRALEMEASIIILKPRSLSEGSLDLIEQSCGWNRVCVAIELGGPRQRIVEPIDRQQAGELPYFAVLWIRPPEGSGE